MEPCPLTPVFIDACVQAADAFFNGEWQHTPWTMLTPDLSSLHINHKEVLALEPACQRWAHLWANRKVIIHSDKQAAFAQINKGSSNPLVMASLRRIFWLSATYNFRLFCVYLPGEQNKVADAASRYHEGGGADRLANCMHFLTDCVYKPRAPARKSTRKKYSVVPTSVICVMFDLPAWCDEGQALQVRRSRPRHS